MESEHAESVEGREDDACFVEHATVEMSSAQFDEADAAECNEQELTEEDMGRDDEAMDIYELNDDKRKIVYENVPYCKSRMGAFDLHSNAPRAIRKAVC